MVTVFLRGAYVPVGTLLTARAECGPANTGTITLTQDMVWSAWSFIHADGAQGTSPAYNFFIADVGDACRVVMIEDAGAVESTFRCFFHHQENAPPCGSNGQFEVTIGAPAGDAMGLSITLHFDPGSDGPLTSEPSFTG